MGYQQLASQRQHHPAWRRLCLPHTPLMDYAALLEHQALWGQEPADKRCNTLGGLNEAEQALHRELREDHLGVRLRLEQEHIRFGWLRQALRLLAVPHR